jgi:hypothetical protein
MLLNWILLPRAVSSEKRLRARWGSGRWCQQRPGRRVLILIEKMSEDFVNDVLVLNTCNNPHRTTAAAADFDVYVEHPLKSLSPGHGGMTLSR